MNEEEYDTTLDGIMDEYTASKEEDSTSEDSVATTDDQTTKIADEAKPVEDSKDETVDDKPQETNSESGEEATETTDEEPAKKSKPTGGINKKIKQLTKQRRQAERETREANKRYADLETRLKKFEDAQVQSEKPKSIEDFETVTDWQRHLAKEEAQKGIDEYKKQMKIEAQESQEVNQLQAKLQANSEIARKIMPDFDEVMEDFPRDLPMSIEVQKLLAGTEAGPLTMYHMTCNEKVVDALNNAKDDKEVNSIISDVHKIISQIQKNPQPASTETIVQPEVQGTKLTPPKAKVISAPPKQGRTGVGAAELEDLEGDDFFNEFSKVYN